MSAHGRGRLPQDISWVLCALIGCILSATDPVTAAVTLSLKLWLILCCYTMTLCCYNTRPRFVFF